MEKLNIGRKENFEIECIAYLNTGEKIFNIGDKTKIISSELIEVEEDFKMRVYKTKEKISLCDFEINEYFKLSNELKLK